MRKVLNYIKSVSPIFALILIFVFINFSVLSCENSINEVKTDADTNPVEQPAVIIPSNKGSIKIGITVPKNQNIRTAMPQMSLSDLRSIKLTGTFKGTTYEIANWYWYYDLQNDIEAYFLEVGTWSLTLSADYNGYTFSDTKAITVTEGLSQNVNFKLSSDTTTGGLVYTINTNSDKTIDHVDYEIKKYPSGEAVTGGTGTLIPINESEYYKCITLERNGENALAGGTYRIVFKFYGGTGNSLYLNTYSEIIRIAGGITTSKNKFLDLNDVYKIIWHLNGGSLQPGDSLVEYYSIHSDYSEITFPELTKNGYKWGGWFSNEYYSGVPVTAFPSNQTGEVHYYAKWVEGYKLSYEIFNYDNSQHYPLSDEFATQTYKLPGSHDEDADTDLTVYEITDGDTTTNIPCMFYYDVGCTSQVSGGIIGASDISADTTIYIKPTIDHVYVSPDDGTDYDSTDDDTKDKFPFNSTTPAKSVAYAKEWIGAGETNTIYLKTTLREKDDIEALSGTSLQRGALVKRYASSNDSKNAAGQYKNWNLIEITTAVNLEYVTIDGGAEWGTIGTTSSVYNLTNNGKVACGALINVNNTGTYTINLNNVTLQNNDNTETTETSGALYMYGNCSVNITDCTIKNCRHASSGGAIYNSGGTLSITGGEISHNAAKQAAVSGGGAVYSSRALTITNTSFIANEASAFGGAIFNDSLEHLCTIEGCTFTNNKLNSTTNAGKTIYNQQYDSTISDSNLYLKGDISIDSGDIYTDVYKPIKVDSTTSATGSLNPITIIPADFGTAPDFNKQLLTATNTADIATAKSNFTLGGTGASNYIINNAGYIKPQPGTVTVTPGFPGTYSCGYTLSKNNSGDRNIKIILKDSSRNAVATSRINSLKVTLYESGDAIKTWTGTLANNFKEALEFTYPKYIDDPTANSFYVEVSIKPDDDSDFAYSYDFQAACEGTYVTVSSGAFNSSTTLCADDADKKSNVFIANRNITIESLIVSDHETTQAEYMAVMGENPSYFNDSPDDGENQNNRPVDGASWYDVLVYCNKRSMLEGLTPCYTIKKATDTTVDSTDPDDWGTVPDSNDSRWNAVDCNFNANGYRLPTEAEWEYCARGGTLTEPQFTYSGTTDALDNYAWYSYNSHSKTHEVKKKTANALGLYDMSGNLSEWCWDYFIYTIDYSTSATGPIAASSGNKRVIRDSGWWEGPTWCTVAKRDKYDPHSGNNLIGFRVVRKAP